MDISYFLQVKRSSLRWFYCCILTRHAPVKKCRKLLFQSFGIISFRQANKSKKVVIAPIGAEIFSAIDQCVIHCGERHQYIGMEMSVRRKRFVNAGDSKIKISSI